MYYTTNSQRKSKVAVCLYLYHTDLWEEFRFLLEPIKDYIKLYIGLSDTHEFDHKNFSCFDHYVSYHKNYGADVAPFLCQLSNINEPIFLKLHTKKSFWGFKFHINWRHLILNDLIGSLEIFMDNIESMTNHNNGALCSQSLLMEDRELTNRAHIQHLCSLINIDYNTVKDSKFVAGNMFFGQTDLYKEAVLHKKHEIDILLQNDIGKINDTFYGTYTHGMERIFGYIVTAKSKGFAHPKHNTIKILNNKAPNSSHFNLVKMFNYNCYLLEDANVYGKIISDSNDHMLIEWYHMPTITQQTYTKLDSGILIKKT